MLKNSINVALVSAAAVMTVIACGSSGDSTFGDDGGAALFGAEAGSGSNSAFGEGGLDSLADSGIDNQCAADVQTAKLAPLALMLMQDTSGSMWSYVTGTTSKYDAVKQALSTFMGDPASAGIGLGIQFFPLFGSVPNSCTSNADCGAGQCIQKACSVSGALCQSPSDCNGGGGTCVQLQRCHNEQELFCRTTADCGAFGTCDQPIVRGECNNATLSCVASDYATPAAPIAPLPSSSIAISAALNTHIPYGLTPTLYALQGAISAANTYGAAHPGEVVAVVLSTDGIPNTSSNGTPQCPAGAAADSVSAIEAAAAAALPNVKTFVIGVLSPADNTAGAKTTLDGIAAAGGTGSATILGTSATTEADFIAALTKIRGQSLACEFKLPVPAAGTPDYGKVNVIYTDSATKSNNVIGYSGAAASCDAVKGGWYYDVDPATGTPTKVILCPSTCSKVQADPAGSVNVVQGCTTLTVPH